MAQHDRYEMDILKQLTRIANSLEKLEKKTIDASEVCYVEHLYNGLMLGYKKGTEND